MSLDRLDLLEVRLGSGKVYLVPRALLENLVQALPVSAPQLIVSASPSGGPLDPSGLPSEAGEVLGRGVVKQQHKNAKWPHEKPPWVSCHALKRGILKEYLPGASWSEGLTGAQQRPYSRKKGAERCSESLANSQIGGKVDLGPYYQGLSNP
jgi:hypothetical protein